MNERRKNNCFSETGATDSFQQFFIFFLTFSGFVCGVHLVPDVFCGVHDVSKERVDGCVGYQDINAPALIQSLLQTQNETVIKGQINR